MMTAWRRSVAESNCFRRFCRPLPNPSANRPSCFVGAKIGGFSLPAKLSDNYFSKVTLVHPILPPKGGFILDIFIRA